MEHKYTGKYVIVRADKAGVFFGKLVSIKNDTVILSEVRKLYYWSGACAVEQLSIDGVKNKKDSKFTVSIDEMEISNAIQIIPCTEESVSNIKSVKVWKR